MDPSVTEEMQGWGMTSEALKFEWSLKFFHSLDYYLNLDAGLDALGELVRNLIVKYIMFAETCCSALNGLLFEVELPI